MAAVTWLGNSRPLRKKLSHGHLSSHQETELQLRLLVQGCASCLVLEPIGYLFLLPKKLAPDGVSDISKIVQMSLQVLHTFFDVDGPSFTMIFHNSFFFSPMVYFQLVGGLEHLDYFPCHLWDVILPIDELIFFKMVKSPPTR